MENTNISVANAEVVSKEDVVKGSVDGLRNPLDNFYCSIVDDGSRKAKVAIYNACNTDGTPLSDMVGKKIDIVDVCAYEVMLTDDNTGITSPSLRIVLIAKDGTNYTCVSQGVFSSLQKMFGIIGEPSWKDEPVTVKPVEVKTSKNFKVLTLELC